jgi:phage anti-repressor protein
MNPYDNSFPLIPPLIQIGINEEGLAVVSAHELWLFLESTEPFVDWINSRIDQYGLVANQDYTMLTSVDERGISASDYHLSITTAKVLAVVEGTLKGQEARHYFIRYEKQFTDLSSLTRLIVQNNQLLANQQQLLGQLRTDIDRVLAGQPNWLKPVPVEAASVIKEQDPNTLRTVIHNRINEYCAFYGVDQSETYNYLYKRLGEVHRINAYRLIRTKGESLLDVLERYGYLDRVFSLVMAELTCSKE